MIPYIAAMALVIIGFYALLLKDNILKKITGLALFSNGIHLFLLSLGYRAGGVPPIMQDLNFTRLASLAVDPLPQALVLTSIVINLSVTALAVSIIIPLYRKFKTLSVRKIPEMRG